ncbi:MAG: PaaI family thioesterase [Myxococcota bacterium]
MSADEILNRLRASGGLIRLFGIEHEVTSSEIVFRMPIEERHTGRPGAAHGGAVMTLMDTALGGTALVHAVERGLTVSTVELKVNFLRPAQLGTVLESTAEIQSAGRSLIVLSGHAVDSRGERIAYAVGTFMLFSPERVENLAAAPSPDRSEGV